MQEYALYWGIICLIVAVYVLAKGIMAAFRRRKLGSDSLVPPPVYGIVA